MGVKIKFLSKQLDHSLIIILIMKFALTAFASVALPALAWSMPQFIPLTYDATESRLDLEAQALKAEYEALKPQLDASAFGLADLGVIPGLDLSSVVNAGGSQLLTTATPVDLATLKANGYADLAARLEIAGALGLESGKKGLVALKKVLASDMTDLVALAEANQVAQEASDIGIKALNALPRPESLKPGTIENLRALGLSNLATSLEGVGKGLQQGEQAAGFLEGLPNSTFEDKRTEAAIPYAAAPAAPSWPYYNPYLFGYNGGYNGGYTGHGYPYYG